MQLTVAETLSAEPKYWRKQLAAALIVCIALAWSMSAIQTNTGGSSGLSIAKGIFKGLVTPNPSLLFNFTDKGVAYLLLETMAIAFLGTLVGAVIAVPLSFLSASNIVPAYIAILGRIFIMAVRTIPAFVYGLMFIMVTGPGPFAGLLTMSLTSVGMVSKMFIESIEDLDKGILESLDSAGCTLFQKIRYGIMAQLMPSFLSTLIYRFDMNLRDATVLGLVGAGGIGSPLIFAMSSYRWSDAGAILVGLIILVLFVEWFSNKLRTRLIRG
ncbi:MAG: phosphonate ABC transporter, permease protein PhnE [Sphaerochaeta sp.]|uniref:phosphonate ABC transporter, permease protein PhnE n=1 Tax=Sphaerochaeta sp. TaxID=1972642 RepID=UPI003D0A2124